MAYDPCDPVVEVTRAAFKPHHHFKHRVIGRIVRRAHVEHAPVPAARPIDAGCGKRVGKLRPIAPISVALAGGAVAAAPALIPALTSSPGIVSPPSLPPIVTPPGTVTPPIVTPPVSVPEPASVMMFAIAAIAVLTLRHFAHRRA